MEKVKDHVNSKTESVKTHIIINGKDTGISHLSGKELIEKYGDCECEIIRYEKDYGNDGDGPIIAIRSFLQVYVNQG